jgi:hypothetical protein
MSRSISEWKEVFIRGGPIKPAVVAREWDVFARRPRIAITDQKVPPCSTARAKSLGQGKVALGRRELNRLRSETSGRQQHGFDPSPRGKPG